MMDSRICEAQAEYFKALSHPVRVKIVQCLKEGERCVCEIVPYLREEQSNVSRHLAALKRVGILSSEKRGVSVYYRVQDENVYRILTLALESLKRTTREKAAVLR
ncbi:ArsR family transcriptional regulator [Candidatus Aerophobetes bacterium]|uniref:ArsR family transcriptional regulator n=1 Tax=Aerophobetes bacterium TaxID=2030807 RepID=A0A662D4W1_UNCAE|nr:MAG: ArsR family transcriptional regulator [Candidatus Aerophobetes bacterium]